MKMQDKEFDDLFHSKLDDLEMEPSAQVWQNIAGELDGKKRSKRLFPLLGIAASILILITAGILIIPKKVTDKTDQHKQNKLALTPVKPTPAKPDNIAPANIQPAKEEQVAVATPPVRLAKPQHQANKIEKPAVQKEEIRQSIVKEEPVKTEEQPILAAVPQKPEEITKPVKPANEIPSAVKQTDITTPDFQTRPVLASAQIPTNQQDKPAVKKRGIHNFGDLVNIVVARVDKRKDKVIEFSDTDDDQTTVTGLHIGAVNIKRDASVGER